MRRSVLFLVGAVCAALEPTAWSQPAGETAYRIGPKDLLDIRVLEEATLNVERRVSRQGTIVLPFLGEQAVEGLTQEQAAAKLKSALEVNYLQRATVKVQVIEFRSRPVSVLGAVNKPGNLDLSGRWTLLEALTDAGGLAAAHGNVVYILRRAENGLSDRLSISLDDLLVEADPTVNIPIFANDVITVPAAVDVTIFFMGEVQSVGAVTFKSTAKLTLLTAIARAGGLSDRASNRITVKRLKDDGTREEIVIHYKHLLAGTEPDLVLQDQDLILVKESFF